MHVTSFEKRFKPALLIATILALGWPAAVHAQLSYNRKVEAVAATPVPGGGGLHDIVVVLAVEADDPGTTVDLSTEILILVNGTTVATTQLTIDAHSGTNPGCGLGCLVTQACICCEISPGNVICTCGGLIAEVPSQASLQPGDEIMVLLRPAPGALPDPDTSDDVLVISHLGEPIFWNRRIVDVELVPTAVAPGDQFFDVWVEVAVDANYDGILPLAAELELQVNGVPVGTGGFPALDLDLIWTQCANVACDDTVACVMDPAGPFYGTCQPDDTGLAACACLYHPVPDMVFPAIALDPGDELTIILRPAPGALPELPGFPDDDEETRPVSCPEDLTGPNPGDPPDGFVNVFDLLLLLANFGQPSPPAIGDITGPNPGDPPDGIVNVFDLLALLAVFGQNCLAQ